MSETKVDLVGGEKLRDAVEKAGVRQMFAGAGNSQGDGKKSDRNGKGFVSPLNGAPVPAGRPKGVRNKLTNLRDAVLEAFDAVGGAQYLVKLANGTQSDRAAFTGLVAKVLPTQINQQVEGGIRLELSWLGARSIGTTQAQIEPPKTQVLDLETDSDGRYRIKDPTASLDGGQEPGAGAADAVQDAQQGAQGAQGASE